MDGIFTRPRKTRYSEKNMLKTTGNWKGYIKLIDSSCVMCELFLQPVCRYQSEIISTKPWGLILGRNTDKSLKRFSALLFTVTFTALLWDFYFFKLTQPHTIIVRSWIRLHGWICVFFPYRTYGRHCAPSIKYLTSDADVAIALLLLWRDKFKETPAYFEVVLTGSSPSPPNRTRTYYTKRRKTKKRVRSTYRLWYRWGSKGDWSHISDTKMRGPPHI